MNRKIASIHYEREISDSKYDSFFESLKADEKSELFADFKGQISNSNVKCKKCKTFIKDMVFVKTTVCPCCFETIYKVIEKGKLKPTLVYSNFLRRFLYNEPNKYKGKRPEYTEEFFKNQVKIADLKRELEYSIEMEEYKRCEVLKNTIKDFTNKNLKLRRKINE